MHKSRHLTIVGPPFYYRRFLSFPSFSLSLSLSLFFFPSSLSPRLIPSYMRVRAHQAFPTLRPLRCYRVSYDFHRRLCAAGVGPWRKDEKKKKRKKKKGWFGIDSLRLFVLTACPGSRLRFNRLGIIMARVARVLA